MFTAQFALVTAVLALGQQQAPSQHAPAQHEYKELHSTKEADGSVDTTSQVTLKWDAITNANRYTLRISRTPDMSELIHTFDTIQLTHTTPGLPAGQYYYDVEGYKYEQMVGKSEIKRFVVGKPLTVTNTKRTLPAPQIVAPKHLEIFPTYGRVRLAWEPVQGARGYRFRLWNENKFKENKRWKRDAPPRWVTEVQQPWIEVHDAPYTSFMYLESGIYRWDVAAIDKNGGYIGDPAMGFFKVSRQWWLKPEVYIDPRYGFANRTLHSNGQDVNSTEFKLSSPQHSFQIDVDWWLSRQWGLMLGGGIETFDVKNDVGNPPTTPPGTQNLANGLIHALNRIYLSSGQYGWTFISDLGITFQEYPHIKVQGTPTALHVDTPTSLDIRTGIRLYKRWNRRWENQLRVNALIYAWVLTDSQARETINSSVTGSAMLNGLFHWTPHFATGLGFAAEHSASYRFSYSGNFNLEFNYW